MTGSFRTRRLALPFVLFLACSPIYGQAGAPGNSNPPQQPGTPPAVPVVAAPPPPSGLTEALLPIQRTPAAAQNSVTVPPLSPNGFILDWASGTATPDTVSHSGRHTVRLTGINDVLYTYRMEITEIEGADDDLSNFKDLIQEVQGIIPSQVAHAAARNPQCTVDFKTMVTQAKTASQAVEDHLSAMLPPYNNGKYSSISLGTTINAWKAVRDSYDAFEQQVINLQSNLSACQDQDGVEEAIQLIQLFRDIQRQVIDIQHKVDGPHVVEIGYDFERTSDYDVVVTQLFNGAPTDASSVTFHLSRGFEILTLSGGFLLTKLQARAYSSVTAPGPPASGSSTPSTQNVLQVDGLRQSYRPALVALFNYHDPFQWPLNNRHYGLALSAGPTIDVSQGKADTSKFGVFAGVSFHLWNRLFLSAGTHAGEFADFPQGYTAPGQIIPANSGTPTAVKRWTAKFAFAITFKGKDLSAITPGGSGGPAAPSNPTAAAPSGNNPTGGNGAASGNNGSHPH